MKKLLFSVSLCLTLMSTLDAQPTTPHPGNIVQDKPVNLIDVFAQALQSDPTFKQAEATLLSTYQTIPITRALLLPQLSSSANTAYNRDTTRVKAVGSGNPTLKNHFRYDSQTYDVLLTQTLFDLNQWTSYQQSKTSVKAADASYAAALQDLMVRTAQAYFDVLLTEDTLRYTKAEKRAVYQNLEQVSERYKVGLVAITGVYQAQASYDSILAQEITARNNIINARENLRAITGIYYKNLAGLKATVPLVTPNPERAAGWVELGEKYNWTLQAARFNADVAKQNIAIERSGHFPTVSAFADAQHRKTGESPAGTTSNHDATVGVELNFPIFEGFLVNALTKQARYDYQSTLSILEATYRSTVNDARQSYNNVIAGISKIKADRQTIISNQSAVDSTEEGYKVGTQTIFDVLQQQQDLYDAQRQYAADQYDYINNIIALKRAAGTLKEPDLAEINTWLTTQNVTIQQIAEDPL
jgi:outer membrane protein